MSVSRDDERFMARAIQLARSAPFSAPNPRVGAVLVRDGRVISEGLHRGPGTPHAEVAALEGADAAGATLYVNLEPCNHDGLTPPCAPALVATGVSRVVAASRDPDRRVDGTGFSYLRDHGLDVTVGVMAKEAGAVNPSYFHQRRTGRPLVTLKLALTLDGRLGAPDGTSQWITGTEARRVVHTRRHEVDAVMVGARTVLADDPLLTVREIPAARQPLRIVVDASGRVPPTARVFEAGEVVVATTRRAAHEQQIAWKEAGAEVMVLPESSAGVDLDVLLDQLGARRLLEVYCEGGGVLASSLLRADAVDRLELYYGGVVTGAGGPGIRDVGVGSMDEAPRFGLLSVNQLGDDILAIFERRR